MGFVFEIVPENDIEFFKSMGLRDCWGARNKIISKHTKWCADRERNAYLVGIGGGYKDMPEFTDFWWNGTIIRMETVSRAVRNSEGRFDVNWYIHKIPIPKNVWSYKENILKMIEEAFSVDTSWVDEDKVNSIKVNFRCEAEMVKGKQWWESRI